MEPHRLELCARIVWDWMSMFLKGKIWITFSDPACGRNTDLCARQYSIQREGTLHCCRDCERWLQPPNSWVVANPESKELLAVCLRRLRGLSKVRIIDASFIWTEPHSRRVKVKITIQQEAFQGTIIQQTFEVEYVVASQQCDGMRNISPYPWKRA